jgi:GNAT superfamily N-acetyltransferase
MTFLMPWLRSKLGFHLLRVLVMPLDGLPPVKVKHPNLRYAALTEAEALEWCKDPELELNPERVSAAFRRGDFCVGVSEQGRPVGYIWFAFEPAPHIQGAWVYFDPRCRYSYKSFIRPSHRGRRISQELYTQANEICPRRGTVLGILTVDVDNRASLEASRRVGRIPVGYAGFLSLFGRVLAFRTPGAARFGFALGGEPGVARMPTERRDLPSPETLRN